MKERYNCNRINSNRIDSLPNIIKYNSACLCTLSNLSVLEQIAGAQLKISRWKQSAPDYFRVPWCCVGPFQPGIKQDIMRVWGCVCVCVCEIERLCVYDCVRVCER